MPLANLRAPCTKGTRSTKICTHLFCRNKLFATPLQAPCKSKICTHLWCIGLHQRCTKICTHLCSPFGARNPKGGCYGNKGASTKICKGVHLRCKQGAMHSLHNLPFY